MNAADKQKLIRLPRVKDIVGHSRSWIYAEIAANRFPRPIRIGKRSSAWTEESVFNWVQQKIAKQEVLNHEQA